MHKNSEGGRILHVLHAVSRILKAHPAQYNMADKKYVVTPGLEPRTMGGTKPEP